MEAASPLRYRQGQGGDLVQVRFPLRDHTMVGQPGVKTTPGPRSSPLPQSARHPLATLGMGVLPHKPYSHCVLGVLYPFLWSPNRKMEAFL